MGKKVKKKKQINSFVKFFRIGTQKKNQAKKKIEYQDEFMQFFTNMSKYIAEEQLDSQILIRELEDVSTCKKTLNKLLHDDVGIDFGIDRYTQHYGRKIGAFGRVPEDNKESTVDKIKRKKASGWKKKYADWEKTIKKIREKKNSSKEE